MRPLWGPYEAGGTRAARLQGFARISLPCFASAAEIAFVAAAVRAVAQHGWRLLPQARIPDAPHAMQIGGSMEPPHAAPRL